MKDCFLFVSRKPHAKCAGGALTWTGFTPHNAHAQKFMKNAIENCKEHGVENIEVQDIRLGGLVRRLANCKQMLIDYLEGNIEKIEELENEIISHNDKKEGYKDFVWGKIVTANILTNYHH